MRYVCCAGRNQVHVENGTHLECISLVDRIAITIQLIGLIEMRSRLDGTFAVIRDSTAPKDGLSSCITSFQFQPNVESIDSPTREEVSNLSGPHHYVDPRCLSGL